jgi:hypothetical protein
LGCYLLGTTAGEQGCNEDDLKEKGDVYHDCYRTPQFGWVKTPFFTV